MKLEVGLKVDLSKIQGEGDFPCPNCGMTISPDDELGETYGIVDYAIDENGSIEEIIVHCKGCGALIQIVGFGLLRDLGFNDNYETDDDPQDTTKSTLLLKKPPLQNI